MIVGSCLSGAVVQYSSAYGVKLINAPFYVSLWVSCQMSEDTIFQVRDFVRKCRVLKVEMGNWEMFMTEK